MGQPELIAYLLIGFEPDPNAFGSGKLSGGDVVWNDDLARPGIVGLKVQDFGFIPA